MSESNRERERPFLLSAVKMLNSTSFMVVFMLDKRTAFVLIHYILVSGSGWSIFSSFWSFFNFKKFSFCCNFQWNFLPGLSFNDGLEFTDCQPLASSRHNFRTMRRKSCWGESISFWCINSFFNFHSITFLGPEAQLLTSSFSSIETYQPWHPTS